MLLFTGISRYVASHVDAASANQLIKSDTSRGDFSGQNYVVKEGIREISALSAKSRTGRMVDVLRVFRAVDCQQAPKWDPARRASYQLDLTSGIRLKQGSLIGADRDPTWEQTL
ncbi:MAG: hypothetical protein WCB34_03880 [Methylovirgula sp.]